MGRPQSAVLKELSAHASFMVLNVSGGKGVVQKALRACQSLPDLTGELKREHSEESLGSAVSFGSAFWDRIRPKSRPIRLKPFVKIEGTMSAPATGGDIFVHIRSDRADLNYILGQRFLSEIRPHIQVLEEVQSFQYLDQRDLTGFIDGTENPQGEERAAAALVEQEEDPEFAGGSYVLAQRYVHRLDAWAEQAVEDQEKVIGRTKPDSVELPDDKKPGTAHISRVVIEEEGQELEILRHSMPYGSITGPSGLVFLAYSKDLSIFEKMLSRMYGVSGDGIHDHLMDFTTPKTGAFFFAPSLETLADLAIE